MLKEERKWNIKCSIKTRKGRRRKGKRKEKKNKCNEQRTVTNMADIKLTILIISKYKRSKYTIKKQRSSD